MGEGGGSLSNKKNKRDNMESEKIVICAQIENDKLEERKRELEREIEEVEREIETNKKLIEKYCKHKYKNNKCMYCNNFFTS